MDAFTSLIAATIAFVGTHFLLSHPLRAPLVARLGAAGFQGVYSLVALATFAWLILAIRALPPEPLLWTPADWLWIAGAVLMLLASILFVGSLFGNPALPMPGASEAAAAEPRGVFAITRHPMMWAFALWGVVHIAVWPTASNIVVGLGVILLALGGSVGQDAKKTRLNPEWRGWRDRTAFVPFTGTGSATAWWPGAKMVVGGMLLWLVATWLHAPGGAPGVGVWR